MKKKKSAKIWIATMCFMVLMVASALAVLAIGIVGVTASGSTYVSGNISSDTTWTAVDSPYIVTGNILVEEGVTLTIEPEVVVKFNADKMLQIDGELIAKGTEARPIVFTSNHPFPSQGDWAGIEFTNSSADATFDEKGNYLSGSIMQYCTVEYGGSGIAALKIESAAPFIDNCIIEKNRAPGIYISEGSPKITNSAITDNSISISSNAYGGGIYVKGEGIIISDNIIANNSISAVSGYHRYRKAYGGGIYASGMVTISNNTITNNSAVGISGVYSADAYGGGIYASGTIVISDNTVTNNQASGADAYGGGIHVSGTITICNNFIANNSALRGDQYGGGIYASGTVNISGNTITNNSVCGIGGWDYSYGGGIYASGEGINISDNSITFNLALNRYGPGCGGGIYTTGNSITIAKNYITNNEVSTEDGYHGQRFFARGGGIHASGTTITICDNIIIDNLALETDYDGGDVYGGGIYASSAVTIRGNRIINNSALDNGGGNSVSEGGGIYGSATVTNNTIIGNTVSKGKGGGIHLSSQPSINYNNIHGNTPYDVYNSNSKGSPDVDATNNWWGTTDEAEIQAHIYDWFDDSSLGIVSYIPYLTSPVAWPPVASFTYSPQNPVVGEQITFDASSSYDPNGEIDSYEWDFGDGNITNTTEKIITHSCTIAGNYNVTLTVTDNEGATDSTEKIVSVIEKPKPPVASFTYVPSPPYNPVIGENIIFDASLSKGTIVKYTWDFGDGNITDTTEKTIKHAYSSNGTYTVKLTVTDSYGKIDNTIQMVTVKRPPVILVHDYWKVTYETLIFILEINGYECDETLFILDLEPSKDIANENIVGYASKLSYKVKEVRQIAEVNKVDIIAHGMGGLAARWYIEKGDGRESVRKLIMLGTPNEGSVYFLEKRRSEELALNLWKLVGALAGVPTFGFHIPAEADEQMIPNSDFINALNTEHSYTDVIGTKYFTIAGDKSKWFMNWLFLLHSPSENDGLIRIIEVELDDIPLEMYHVDHFELCTNNSILWHIVDTLNEVPPVSQQAFLMKAEAVQQEQEEIPIQAAPMISGKINPGEEKSHEISVSSTNELNIMLLWLEGDLNLTLITTNGTLIDHSTNNMNITHYSDENLTIEGYNIKTPESGVWCVNVTAVNISEGEDYVIMTFLDTNITLSLSLQKYQYDPCEQINIKANLTYGSGAITNASAIAKIQRPDNTTETITLYDDGLHNDNQTDDGIYANTYINTSLWGTYDITVTATGIVDEENFEREAFTIVWVEQYPDLTLNASDISFSNDAPLAGENITTNAIIHNIGEANATNATILFYAGNPANGTAIGEDVVNVTVNATANVSVSWIAKAGVHQIYVLISPYNEFLEENYTNNMAYKVVTVSEKLVFDTGAPANPYPSIFGTHNGTITPNQTITASKLYTYPCAGTGGHTEYARIWNESDWNATATWKGYVGDWHNITFDKTVVLLANETYDYIIHTGSYPQIHHTPALPTANSWINCTKFIDANGKKYTNWIPAIKLYSY